LVPSTEDGEPLSHQTGKATQPLHEVSLGEVFDMRGPAEVVLHVPHMGLWVWVWVAWQSAHLAASVIPSQSNRDETAKRMTGSQSRLLNVGARVCWRDDQSDLGTVTETNWAGVTLKWDNRSQQSVLHNDMACVGVVSKN
jgi:hypothetical protein